MPGVLPDGEPVPADGSLPPQALAEPDLSRTPLAFYIHVPYCASRCGYCDFNTYTASELGGGASQATYAATAIEEIRLARKVLGGTGSSVSTGSLVNTDSLANTDSAVNVNTDLPVQTVFFGGGTPTMLPAADLVALLGAVRDEFGLAFDAEVTTEANPESVNPAYLAELRAGGFNRVSFGMQSAREHVLQILDRRHTPGRPEACVREAREAGFEHVNLDLIYGTPGESDDDWRASLDAAIGAAPDHVSAYSLIVEDGTRLAARVKRGELPMIDDDVHADRYLIADERLAAAGYSWYEVSNWAASPQGRSRHNLLYWTGANWWGVGPGAHSHVGGTRWWNVKHPSAYSQRIAAGQSPAHAREVLDAEDRRVERILLELRLDSGCDISLLNPAGRKAAIGAAASGLLDPRSLAEGFAVLTLKGRLLADAVVRDLVD